MSDPAIDPDVVSALTGRFAPGHLGELTAQIPFEMVDAVLADASRVQRRVRLLPSRVVVYLLLAGGLFSDMGWSQVWSRLSAGLPVGGGASRARGPSRSSIWAAMRRVGPRPLRLLFDLLKGPALTAAGGAGGRASRFAGLLLVAIDGTTINVPDAAANLRVFHKQIGNGNGAAGYPSIRLVALVACGTRTLIDAVFGPTSIGETTYARPLCTSLREGMLLLGDRNFPSKDLIATVRATGAEILMRIRTGTNAPALAPVEVLTDGTWIAMHGPTRVRVIDADITITTDPDTENAATSTSRYRLVTSLNDPDRYPADALVELYHERWEIETSYREFKSTILHGRVLRGQSPETVNQEVWALLCTYQALRLAIADAVMTDPAIDPDRASFTIALNTARDLTIQASGITTHRGHPVDLVGHIGNAILGGLLPRRRPRTRPRAVKRAISKYQARTRNTDRTSRPIAVNHQIHRLRSDAGP